MNAIAEIAVAILTGFIQFLAWLLSIVFSSSYLAAHSTGARRVVHVIGAICALHLFADLTIPIVTEFNSYLLSPLFKWQVMVAALVVLIICIATSTAIEVAAHAKQAEPDDVDTPDLLDIQSPLLLGIPLILAVGLGALSIFSAQTERKTTKEKLCEAAAGRISDDWKARADVLADLSEKYLKKDISGLNPCAPKPEQS